MTTTLRDFISNREGEIKDLLKSLKVELRELQVARAALDGQSASPPPPAAAGPTIKDMAKAVLAEANDGMTSAEILTQIRERFGREIDRTSLSPQLSRMKEAEEVTLAGEKWFSKENYATWVQSFFDDDDEEEESVRVVIIDDDDL